LPQLAGLILESGIADVVEALEPMFGEVHELSCTKEELLAEIKTHFDLGTSLQGYKGSILVLHAAQDQLIDSSHAERLHAWAGGKDKKLVVFPGGNHNTVLLANYVEYVEEVKSFLQRAGMATSG